MEAVIEWHFFAPIHCGISRPPLIIKSVYVNQIPSNPPSVNAYVILFSINFFPILLIFKVAANGKNMQINYIYCSGWSIWNGSPNDTLHFQQLSPLFLQSNTFKLIEFLLLVLNSENIQSKHDCHLVVSIGKWGGRVWMLFSRMCKCTVVDIAGDWGVEKVTVGCIVVERQFGNFEFWIDCNLRKQIRINWKN